MSRPQPELQFTYSEGSLWTHVKTGDVYVVVGNGVIENGCVQAVLYKRVDTVKAVTWVRPCLEFADGRFVQFRHTCVTHDAAGFMSDVAHVSDAPVDFLKEADYEVMDRIRHRIGSMSK